MLANFGRNLTRSYCIGARQALAVQERIKDKKKDALLGGGARRIEAQHKKVCKVAVLSIGNFWFWSWRL